MKNLLSQLAQARKTTKVRVVSGEDWTPTSSKKELEKIIAAAHWAPFHLPAREDFKTKELISIVPWRFHALDGKECKILKKHLLEEKKGIKSVDAITQMLAAAEACIIINWLPTDNNPIENFPTLSQIESIAAASAATQSLLLSATENEYKNYWYTGGVIRTDADVWNWLGIKEEQKYLLGVVFLFPKDVESKEAMVVNGAHRQNRGELHHWLKWVTLHLYFVS